jgi:hypothetical protein
MSMSVEHAVAIASVAGGLSQLLTLAGSHEAAVQGDAAATLFYVSLIEGNRGGIIAAGGIPVLVNLLKAPAAAGVQSQ